MCDNKQQCPCRQTEPAPGRVLVDRELREGESPRQRCFRLLAELSERRDDDLLSGQYRETVVEIRDALAHALPDFSPADTVLEGVRSLIEEVQDTRDADANLTAWLFEEYGVFVGRDEVGRITLGDLQAAIQLIAPIR